MKCGLVLNDTWEALNMWNVMLFIHNPMRPERRSERRKQIYTKHFHTYQWPIICFHTLGAFSDPPAAVASASGRTWSACRAVTVSWSPSSFLLWCWSPPGLRHRSSSSRWRSVPFLPAGRRCCSGLWRQRGNHREGLKTDHENRSYVIWVCVSLVIQ